MHGPTECLGNMLSLCANNLFPNNPKISLGFSTCLIRSYQRIPSRDLVQSCSLEHGIPFEDLNSCVSEEGKGLDLLEASIRRTDEASVKKSCTVSLYLAKLLGLSTLGFASQEMSCELQGSFNDV